MKRESEPPASIEEEKGTVDYRQYLKDRFELKDEEADRIKSLEVKNLPEYYKKQYETLND